ncbi:unnamed protein product [Prorocentrum cordatum]|uniref:Uncharacterized protein n=1 Tax=Prorocentrum cordatum TaxID=2364126 RepID=A0ABN9USR1_9DINO|nr:unnamed protein product [Polarella glacialis]
MLFFWNLTFLTKCQESVQVALDQHILLVQIRDMANKLCKSDQNKCGPNTTAILREACDSVLAASNVTREEIGMRCTVRLSFRDRGIRCVIETPVLPWEESLVWRASLLEGRSDGWHSLRACWIALLQHPGYRRKGPLSAEQAAGFVDARRHIAELTTSRMSEREQRRMHSTASGERGRLQSLFAPNPQGGPGAPCASRRAWGAGRRRSALARSRGGWSRGGAGCSGFRTATRRWMTQCRRSQPSQLSSIGAALFLVVATVAAVVVGTIALVRVLVRGRPGPDHYCSYLGDEHKRVLREMS